MPLHNGMALATGVLLGPSAHPQSHPEQDSPVGFVEPRKQFGKAPQLLALFALRTPGVPVKCRTREFDFLRRLAAFVEQAVKRNIQRTCIFLQRLNRWDSVTILDAAGVAAEQTCALLDGALAQILCF